MEDELIKSLVDTQTAILDTIGHNRKIQKKRRKRSFASWAKSDFDTNTSGKPILP